MYLILRVVLLLSLQ